jgi:hypothetical protein
MALSTHEARAGGIVLELKDTVLLRSREVRELKRQSVGRTLGNVLRVIAG